MGTAFVIGIAMVTMALFFGTIFAVATYIFEALGYYALAKNRGFEHAWIAWIPIVNTYLLGELTGDKMWNMQGSKWILPIGGAVIMMLNASFVGLPIGFPLFIAYLVYYYMCLYKLFKIYKPESAELYTVTSIIFDFMASIWLFVIRNNAPDLDQIETTETSRERMYDNIYHDELSNQNYEIPEHVEEVTVTSGPAVYESVWETPSDLYIYNEYNEPVSSEKIYEDDQVDVDIAVTGLGKDEAAEIDKKIDTLTENLESYLKNSDEPSVFVDTSDIFETEPVDLRLYDEPSIEDIKKFD